MNSLLDVLAAMSDAADTLRSEGWTSRADRLVEADAWLREHAPAYALLVPTQEAGETPATVAPGMSLCCPSEGEEARLWVVVTVEDGEAALRTSESLVATRRVAVMAITRGGWLLAEPFVPAE